MCGVSWCPHHGRVIMKDVRTATLPSVLTEYCPEFDIIRAKATGCGEETSPKVPRARTNKSVKQQNRQKTPLPRSQTPGSAKHSAKVKKEEREHQERVAESWAQARIEVHQERHEQLSQKIVLQHALIKSQAELSRELRRQEEEKQTKKRSEDLYSKHARENALEAKCKQSIDLDRKARRKPTKTKGSRELVLSGSESDTGDATSPSTSSPISPMGSEHRMRKSGAHSHGGYLPSSEYSSTLPQSPMRELEDEDECDDQGGGRHSKGEVVTPADLSQLPWHHAQLYRMYGRNADYYIHPKMQVEQKKIVHPTLKSQKVKKMGHMGASHIWNALRTDSKSKLFRSDRRFPQELKDAFSSHVREGINNQKKPVYRNFTVTDDVPDLNRLMDQSLLRRVAVLRHKTELMYRSSQTNNDRTKVLLFNSPLPAVNEGDEGIGKYLPSWSDDASEISEESYMKWMDEEKRMELKRLKAAQRGKTIGEDRYEDDGLGDEEEEEERLNDKIVAVVDVENKPPAPPSQPVSKSYHPKSVLSPVPSTTSEGLQAVWHNVMARQKPRREPRYHFLTEEEARVDGAFLEKLGLEKDRIDPGRIDLLSLRGSGPSRGSLPGSLKSMSALETRRSFASGSGNTRSDSAQNSSSRFQTSWQPLSMHALIEFKDQMGTQGLGEFQQGRPRMWPTANTNNTAVQQQQ